MNSIGRYQIVQKLGQGGMGAVYQAFDPQIQRTVAIKIISTHMVDRPDLRERFFREARAAGQLSHRNIITIYDMGEHEGQPYITMEFVEGRDLDWHMRHGEPMSLARKLDIISEICDGLAYAHERGIIHRDVKPANVMVAPGGQVKILDFGLARVVSSDLTRSNMMFGTMEYMAPEQIRAEAVDHRADIFSVGALFYELLTGRRAFQADTFAATMYRILQEVPEPIHELTTDVPPHVAAIVERALAKSRTERYQSMPEMLRAVRLAQQALETGGWTEAATTYGSSPSPLTPPLTPPDAPTMEISRPPSPPPGTPTGTPPPGTPPPSGTAAQTFATGPASGPAQQTSVLSRAGLGVKAAGAAVLVLLIAGGVYLATRSSGSRPPTGETAGTTGTESVPPPPVQAPAPPAPPAPSPGSGAGNQEQPSEPAPSNPATSAPAEQEAPREAPKPPPDATERRADAAARARAESALRQMAQARNNAETSKAPDLVPDAYRRAVAQEREARGALAKGDYLQAVASAHEARASYVLADSEARRIGAAREEEARRAATRQEALDQLQALRRTWSLNRQAAERAGASTTGGGELAQAIGRVDRAEQIAEQDPEGAIRAYQEAIALAQHARDEAVAAARKAAEAAKAKPPAPAPAPAPTPPAPAPSSAEAARRGIEDLLQRYVGALQGRDIDALKQIWPSLSGDAERAIREQFANARAISVTLGSPQITVSNGTAVVVCRRDYEVETRDGQRPRTSTRTTLQLRRNENRWLIENIRYEPLE